jgi:hypothetical protein
VDDPSLRRVQPSEFMAPADRLHDFWARFRQLLRGRRPQQVVVLHTRSYQNWAYNDAFKRASLEAAVMVAARVEDISYELITQERTARHLGLPATWRAGDLKSAAAGLIEERPAYWADRALAYAAAVTAAASRGGESDDP